MSQAFPYIERQSVWGNTFDAFIAGQRGYSWYSVAFVIEADHCTEQEACRGRNEWNTPLREMVRPGDTVIDVGANEGWLTTVLAKRVGPAGRVIAIEPHRINVAMLHGYVYLNGLSNIEIVRAAIGERFGTGFMRKEIVYGEPPGEEVPVVPLDSYCDDHPNVVKIDVEGHELAVLRGGREMLRAIRPKLEIELHLEPHGVDMRHAGFDPAELFSILAESGYRSFFKDGQPVSASPSTSGVVYCYPN